MTTDGQAAGEQARGTTRARSHLFAIRVWREDVAPGSEYRGRVREVTSGAFRNFREWSDLAAFMVARIEEAEIARADAADAIEGGRHGHGDVGGDA